MKPEDKVKLIDDENAAGDSCCSSVVVISKKQKKSSSNKNHVNLGHPDSTAVNIPTNANANANANTNGKSPTKEKSAPSSSSSSGWRLYTGIFFCIMGTGCMSITSLIVKLLHGYHPFSLTVWRYLGNVIPSIPLIIYLLLWKKQNVFTPIWPLTRRNNNGNNNNNTTGLNKNREKQINFFGIWARGFLGGAATILRFTALQYLSMSDVSVISRSTPACVFILAYFFLKEKCSAVSIISALLAVGGVFVLSRPPMITGEEFDKTTLIGLGLSVGALVCSAGTIIISRRLKKVHFSLLILGFGLIGMIEGIVLSFSYGVFRFPEGMRDILLTVALAVITFIGQVFSVLAFKFDDAGPISIFRMTYVLFAFLWQIVFLHVYPDDLSIVGAVIVLSGIVLLAVRKWVRAMPEDRKMRKYLCCVLL